MVMQSARDRRGNEIYLTEERWRHICHRHPEMPEYQRELFDTIRRGRRYQKPLLPQVYLYYRDYPELPYGNTTIVVVVKFGYDENGFENNFVLTAYQTIMQRAL